VPAKRNTKKPIRKSIIYPTSEEELQKRLILTIGGIVLFIAVSLVTLALFAPKIGGIFGFISANRNAVNIQPEIAPTPPVFSNIPRFTRNETITINGMTEPGSTVKLFLNGPEFATTVAGNDGLFTFINLRLIEGQNTVYARTINEKGLESAQSERITIVYDIEPPEVTILEPENDSTVKNLDRRIRISGSLNERASVRINDQLAVVRPDLTFDLLLGVDEGEVEITIIATDEAGNTAEEKLTVTYERASE
jgi:hypothetical protein